MASKFTEEVRVALLDLFADGLTLRDACRELDLREKTVKGWLTRGRKDENGDYANFATAVDAIREDRSELEMPGTEDELRVVVWSSAKKGSVAAQKLYWEILRTGGSDAGEDDQADPFAELDPPTELAERREAKAVHG